MPTASAKAPQYRVLVRGDVWSNGTVPGFYRRVGRRLLDWTHVLEKHNKQWAENARAYHRYVSSNDLCLTHALTDQYYDRTKRASEQEIPI
jgi:hypothetical protein